ncbi:MAG: universal stress protein [Deltaproteobacteria bacterium]|nr:universal stress protein [Deltaproteobacteria bacterium]MCL4874789.1 universal stress protein [bacterium]
MKILFCHDGSENAQKALDKTLDLFKLAKPEIVLLMVVEGARDASMENEEIFEKQRSDGHDYLMKTARYITGKGFDVDVILATGDARKMIVETSRNKQPDIMVVSKRGGGLLDNMVLGSVSAYVVRHARCPVLVLHT